MKLKCEFCIQQKQDIKSFVFLTMNIVLSLLVMSET